MGIRSVPSVAKLTEADQSVVLTSILKAVDEASEKELTRDQRRNLYNAWQASLTDN